MIVLFTLANVSFVARSDAVHWNWGQVSIALLLMLSFFFRMRLFDEIKDYDTDLKVNPTRPLPRGVLSIIHVKRMIAILLLLELALASCLGPWAFGLHLFAVFYSLLMYEEFFIGDLIRPHLTTYAVMHTLVSVFLGVSAASSALAIQNGQFVAAHISFFLMNWCFFNLFEFGRKTFSSEEERSGVDTYSSLFGGKGAVALCVSQGVLGILLLGYSAHFAMGVFWISLSIFSVVGLNYLFRPQAKNAKLFRAACGVYLLTHYGLIIYYCI